MSKARSPLADCSITVGTSTLALLIAYDATLVLHDIASEGYLQPESCVMIERSVLLPAGTDEVWRALTESDHLSRWFGSPVELDLKPGGRVTVREGDRIRRGLV